MQRATLLALLLASVSRLFAQYGTAPPNYYPATYGGTTFTGTLTATEGDQITLTFTKGSKAQTFVGRFETACAVPKTDQTVGQFRASDIPSGTVLVAFFNPVTKKVNGTKVKENIIIAFAVDVVNGKKIPDEKKTIYPCTSDEHLKLKFW
jgi:hypothetical protein